MKNQNANFDEIKAKAEAAEKTPVNIALFGQPGAGKSSLVNAIIGQTLAKVGVENDVTTFRTDYDWNGLFLSDLPGYGTAKFPADQYFEKFEIAKFDVFLCVASGKLKDDDIRFFKDLVHAGKRCLFVRNKFDAEFEEGVTESELRARITKSINEQVGTTAQIIFTSCRTMQGLDNLQSAIVATLSGVKHDRFLRSAAAYSKEFLDAKREACCRNAIYAAGVSAGFNMVPLPGVGIIADLGIVFTAMKIIRSDFGLTEARLDRFVNLMPGVGPMINTVITMASQEGVMLLLKQFGGRVAVAEIAKYVPFVGTVIAGSVSFLAIRYVLHAYIDDCYKIADEMLKSQFRG